MKVPPHVVERLLNHKMGGISNKTDGIVSAVAEVYNRATYLPEMREAIARWLWGLGLTLKEVRMENNYALRYACYGGHECIARWLVSCGLTPEDLRATDLLTRYVYSDSGIARWLRSIAA